MISTALVLALLATSASAALKPAKEYFDICHTSDPNLNDCILKTITKLIPTVTKGIPEFNLPPFDPLVIPKIEMGEGHGQFNLHMILHNLTIHGISNLETKDLIFDLDKWIFNYTSFFPKLDFSSDYELEGQILVLSLKGTGVATFKFTDVNIISHVELEEFKKGEKSHFRVKNYKLRIEPGHASSYFTNLFNGDKVLGDTANKFLNDNWKDAFEAYHELPEQAFSEFLKSVVNRVYYLFPKDELFPK